MKLIEARLDDLGSVSRGRSRHRPRDAEHLYGGPHPFVQTGDIKRANLYLHDYHQTYSDAGLAQSKMWPCGTLCITIAANIADTAILGIDACFPDSVIGFIPYEDRADARYVKYLIDTIKTQYQQVSRGATQDNLSQEKLLSFTLRVPEVGVQIRVADTLSAYDDLIANNTRRIKLLEDAARLLYEEWFVRLRFPGHEHTPVQDGIPEGWDAKTVGELCETPKETVDPTRLDPITPYIGLEHIPRRSITLADWGHAEQVESTKYRFVEGDILFGKIRAYFHKVGMTINDGITSSDAIVVRANDADHRWLLLMTVSSDQFVRAAAQTAREGSKMPRADWNVMQQYRVLIPPRQILLFFNEFIEPITRQLKSLSFATHRAREARDLLLPRLMSGKVAV